MRVMIRDAARHRSPNAGWPETALAAALDIRLSGPRAYDGVMRDEAWLHPEGRDPEAQDIAAGLSRFTHLLWVVSGLMLLGGGALSAIRYRDIRAMTEHGGDLDRAIAHYGGARSDWIDLSTGINPHSYPLPALAADAWTALPDKQSYHQSADGCTISLSDPAKLSASGRCAASHSALSGAAGQYAGWTQSRLVASKL